MDELSYKTSEARQAVQNRATEAKKFIEEKASSDDRDAQAKRVEREAVKNRNTASENIQKTANKAASTAKDGVRSAGEGIENLRDQATKAGA